MSVDVLTDMEDIRVKLHCVILPVALAIVQAQTNVAVIENTAELFVLHQYVIQNVRTMGRVYHQTNVSVCRATRENIHL